MNNFVCPLVHYYDVWNFHATIFKYTRALHVSVTTRISNIQHACSLRFICLPSVNIVVHLPALLRVKRVTSR